ncbi:helix-turn-helix domain-containing protein [Paractinoplanes rishiriensis]|uniref:helix-turn-helix domain-containing protein n=1 Tax=Paractinoplanes rishiriensis TaxID=1050105 RepID=UPI001940B2D1
MPWASLAEIAGVSLRCLRREFHRQVGLPPMAYLRKVRLARAHAELTRHRFPQAVGNRDDAPVGFRSTRPVHATIPGHIRRESCRNVPHRWTPCRLTLCWAGFGCRYRARGANRALRWHRDSPDATASPPRSTDRRRVVPAGGLRPARRTAGPGT